MIFTATEEHVDPAAAGDPSCHFPLAAEYRFTTNADRLEFRRQTVDYAVEAGKCVPRGAASWTETVLATRLAGGDTVSATSGAGGGTLRVEPAPAPPRIQSPAPPPARKPPAPAPNKGKNLDNEKLQKQKLLEQKSQLDQSVKPEPQLGQQAYPQNAGPPPANPAPEPVPQQARQAD